MQQPQFWSTYRFTYYLTYLGWIAHKGKTPSDKKLLFFATWKKKSNTFTHPPLGRFVVSKRNVQNVYIMSSIILNPSFVSFENVCTYTPVRARPAGSIWARTAAHPLGGQIIKKRRTGVIFVTLRALL